MGKIYAVNCDDLPYGPGQSDYEYDRKVQEEMDMDEKHPLVEGDLATQRAIYDAAVRSKP